MCKVPNGAGNLTDGNCNPQLFTCIPWRWEALWLFISSRFVCSVTLFPLPCEHLVYVRLAPDVINCTGLLFYSHDPLRNTDLARMLSWRIDRLMHMRQVFWPEGSFFKERADHNIMEDFSERQPCLSRTTYQHTTNLIVIKEYRSTRGLPVPGCNKRGFCCCFSCLDSIIPKPAPYSWMSEPLCSGVPQALNLAVTKCIPFPTYSVSALTCTLGDTHILTGTRLWDWFCWDWYC